MRQRFSAMVAVIIHGKGQCVRESCYGFLFDGNIPPQWPI